MEEASGLQPGNERRPPRTRRWNKALESNHGAHHPPRPVLGWFGWRCRVGCHRGPTSRARQRSPREAQGGDRAKGIIGERAREGRSRPNTCCGSRRRRCSRDGRTWPPSGWSREGPAVGVPAREGEESAARRSPGNSRGGREASGGEVSGNLWRSSGAPSGATGTDEQVSCSPRTRRRRELGTGACSGKRNSPRHGNAHPATWPRGNPGVERAGGVHDRVSSRGSSERGVDRHVGR